MSDGLSIRGSGHLRIVHGPVPKMTGKCLVAMPMFSRRFAVEVDADSTRVRVLAASGGGVVVCPCCDSVDFVNTWEGAVVYAHRHATTSHRSAA